MLCAGEVKMMRNVDSQSRLSGRIRKEMVWCAVGVDVDGWRCQETRPPRGAQHAARPCFCWVRQSEGAGRVLGGS